ncbi:MAG TPA: helix-turn-helix transcriptional regulator [Polyangiaceae bacterium]|nr:helix-turn-helix transcriptional regulator [Polyangiaceae bacterium]
MQPDSSGESELCAAAKLAAGHSDAELLMSTLWHELVGGRYRIVASFTDEAHFYLVLAGAERVPTDRKRPGRRDVTVLESILSGKQQKVIAIEDGLAPSTVAVAAAQCARSMGLACTATQVPTVLFIAAHAKIHDCSNVRAQHAAFDFADEPFEVIRVRRPDSNLLVELSKSERAIADLLIDRHSNAQIARLRKRSSRTIANQLGSIYRKLKASGRTNILALLVSRWCEKQRDYRLPAPVASPDMPPPASYSRALSSIARPETHFEASFPKSQ